MERDKRIDDINGCATEVHNTLGNGFSHALFIFYCIREASQVRMKFINAVWPLAYNIQELSLNGKLNRKKISKEIHTRAHRADFVVEKKVIVELIPNHICDELKH